MHALSPRHVPLCLLLLVAGAACDSKSKAPEPAAATSPAADAADPAPAPEPAAPTNEPQAAPSEDAPQAVVGQPAPDFTLPDLDGNPVRLADHRGKTVVLEWFNPQCPFVRMSHTKGSLVDAPARHQKDGVVWLAINSNAAGKQGHDPDVNRHAMTEFGMKYPLLRDEAGTVGRQYGATHTPHLFVIDPKGTLVYAGAIDNSPDGEGASPEGGTLVRYVDQALAELAANKPVSVPQTKAYGCTVKYVD